MFTELLPVLKDRMITLTIARVDDTLIRVNVVPKRTSEKESDAAQNGLSTPLTVTATAEELDREFAQQVRGFSASYTRASANIREIEAAHTAAVKAAEEEKKNAKGLKTGTPAGKATTQKAPNPPVPAHGKLVFGQKTASEASPAKSLFDAAPSEQEQSDVPVQQANTQTEAVPVPPPAGASGDPPTPEAVICQICKGPILPSQERHSLMPFPAHASSTQCEAARARAGQGTA